MFKVSLQSQRDCSYFQPWWNEDLCCSHNKAWTRLTWLHNKRAGAMFMCTEQTFCPHTNGWLESISCFHYNKASIKVCVRLCLPADMGKYTKRTVLLLPCWWGKPTTTSRYPKDNSAPTREGNHTRLSAESDLAECVLKNSSVYPQGLDFQWVLEDISYQI